MYTQVTIGEFSLAKQYINTYEWVENRIMFFLIKFLYVHYIYGHARTKTYLQPSNFKQIKPIFRFLIHIHVRY